MNTENRVAVVTGASRGIGRAIATCLARDGCHVLVNYRQAKHAAEETAEWVRKAGREALIQRADVTRRHEVTVMLELALRHFGRLDVLVNNAGLLDQKPFAEISDEDWTKAFDVNLKAAFVCTQEAAPQLARHGGCIVNISSVGGQIGGPKAPHYAAAKGGLLTFTKSSARLLADQGIRVNAVAPGLIRTDMIAHMFSTAADEAELCKSIPLQRMGEPEDVGEAVAFLASSRARYITGQVLNVNGGLWLP